MACALIGVTHSVVFGAFPRSPSRTASRNLQASQAVITCAGSWVAAKGRRLKTPSLHAHRLPQRQGVIVYSRTAAPSSCARTRPVANSSRRRLAVCPAEELDSGASLYVFTPAAPPAKTKGHRYNTAGYLLKPRWTIIVVFDRKEEDTYWYRDIGWVTDSLPLSTAKLEAGLLPP